MRTLPTCAVIATVGGVLFIGIAVTPRSAGTGHLINNASARPDVLGGDGGAYQGSGGSSRNTRPGHQALPIGRYVGLAVLAMFDPRSP